MAIWIAVWCSADPTKEEEMIRASASSAEDCLDMLTRRQALPAEDILAIFGVSLSTLLRRCCAIASIDTISPGTRLCQFSFVCYLVTTQKYGPEGNKLLIDILAKVSFIPLVTRAVMACIEEKGRVCLARKTPEKEFVQNVGLAIGHVLCVAEVGGDSRMVSQAADSNMYAVLAYYAEVGTRVGEGAQSSFV